MPRELRIIARDITERKRGQDTRLMHLQQQRDEISHEVQHRIKNSLQAVIGLLTMNMDASPELKPILTTSIAQINTISVVNGLILDGKEDIEILLLLESLAKAFSQLFNCKIDYNLQCNTKSKVMLTGEEVIAVSLIYSELLINAFKHSRKNSSGDEYISVGYVLNQSDVEIKITNTCDNKHVTASDNTSFGHSMIHSLMPPQGANIKISQNEGSYEVVLVLMDPVLFHEIQ